MGQVLTKNEGFSDFCEGWVPFLLEIKQKAGWLVGMPAEGMTQIPNEPPYDKDEHSENVMGYSIRVDKFRFTEWYRFNRTTATPNFTDIYGTELYDHSAPTTFFDDENVNLAGESEMESVVKSLRQMLQAGWRAALPPSP